MRDYLTVAAGLIALSAASAWAQDAAQPTELNDRHLAEVDADKNGGVTQSEFSAFMKRGFDALDKDVDGFVSWVEAEAAMIRAHFDAIDANKDAGLTAAEFDAQAQKDFAASDRDGDGALD